MTSAAEGSTAGPPAAPDPYTDTGLAELLTGEPAYRRTQVTGWLAKGIDDPSLMSDLPASLRETLAQRLRPPPRVAAVSRSDRGLTVKVLLECGASDGAEAVESVLMLYPRKAGRAARATVCISTQAGCAMGCPFCATGQAGFRRQLTVSETVRQVTVAQRLLATAGRLGDIDVPIPPGVPDHVTNVVFMGMGEPLANIEVTVDAVRWLHGSFGLSARSITVSTVGLIPGIRRLQALDLPITLAVSLHAPDDGLRDDLVPVNRRHPLGELLATVADYLGSTRRRVTFEYVMIDGINTSLDQARRLAALLRRHLEPKDVHVNLIPMNPTPAVPWRAPPPTQQQAFAGALDDAGIPATVRRNRGNDIDAACGQLYANYRMASGRTLPAAVGAAGRVTGP